MTRADQHADGARPADPAKVGLPVRSFLYTLDQIAYLLSMSEDRVQTSGMVYYHGRSVGAKGPDRMMARNISAPDRVPEWRVAEQELIRWMRRKGYKIYERKWVTE